MAAQSGGSVPHRFILHITSRGSWPAQQTPGEQGRGDYRDPSLDAEGFIHCSTVDQYLVPANERFAGRNDLVLLVIDTERLDSKPVYEDCYQSGTRFPHVYGPIPFAAVVATVGLPPDADGGFSEPDQLRSLLIELTADSGGIDGAT